VIFTSIQCVQGRLKSKSKQSTLSVNLNENEKKYEERIIFYPSFTAMIIDA